MYFFLFYAHRYVPKYRSIYVNIIHTEARTHSHTGTYDCKMKQGKINTNLIHQPRARKIPARELASTDKEVVW